MGKDQSGSRIYALRGHAPSERCPKCDHPMASEGLQLVPFHHSQMKMKGKGRVSLSICSVCDKSRMREERSCGLGSSSKDIR